ncbi:DUF4919 domain-containing protein [Chryseobacterium formosus]|uniref:DUF4919 domain-containing protein n=1 Tax=Chryseobacterium formosus TaxID=1537363 RepID=A0ABT3XVK1_9FLAO|nr:DUF4919 domain-containing protein [Chryseobacterium formosus]MCX8525679.1 DUF4919 domain-containing protein [Chryseobacterium formosus]
MKKNLFTLLFLLLAHFMFGQIPPPPPEPPAKEKINSDKSSSLRMYGEEVQAVFPKFNIPLSLSNDKKSIYYFKNVEEKIIQLDSTVTAEQIISLTKFNISKNNIDPTLLDSLANRTYKLNEEKNYTDAIKTAQILLKKSPNNITGHKEISLAYKKIGEENLSAKHLGMMSKIITSIFKYGDGNSENPFLINNFFEGFSIYEAAYRCKPKKVTLILDKKQRLLGAYNGYSAAMDQILIKYSELSHWKPQLKEGDYTVLK